MSRNSIVGLCLLTVDCRLHFFQGWGWVSQGPFHSQQMPLVQRQPPPPFMSVWRRSPIRLGLFPSPFLHTFPLPQAGGKSLGTKVSLCLDRPPPSASTSSFSFPGQRASSLEWVGVKEGIRAVPLPRPPVPSPISPSVWNEAQQPGLPFSPQARPLSQWVALWT